MSAPPRTIDGLTAEQYGAATARRLSVLGDLVEPVESIAAQETRWREAIGRSIDAADCPIDHDAVKLDDAAWSRLTFVGVQPTYADPPEASALELRNCVCHSTLCREVKL